jgi:mercuric ion transport protein
VKKGHGPRRASIGGAVLAAATAPSCCIGPLILSVLGIGGAGAFARIAAYRPYVLGVTVVLLGAGFYFTYRVPPVVEGDACGCERSRWPRTGKIALWLATIAVVFLAAFPNLAGFVGGRSGPDLGADQTAMTEQVAIVVRGVDCEACAVQLKTALKKVGGFHDLTLDVRNQSIMVTYEPATGRLNAYMNAIDHLGHEAAIAPTRRRASR